MGCGWAPIWSIHRGVIWGVGGLPSGVSIGMLYEVWVGSYLVPSGVAIGMLYGMCVGSHLVPSGVSIGMLYGVWVGSHREYP